jgi:hypothetical protein
MFLRSSQDDTRAVGCRRLLAGPPMEQVRDIDVQRLLRRKSDVLNKPAEGFPNDVERERLADGEELPCRCDVAATIRRTNQKKRRFVGLDCVELQSPISTKPGGDRCCEFDHRKVRFLEPVSPVNSDSKRSLNPKETIVRRWARSRLELKRANLHPKLILDAHISVSG